MLTASPDKKATFKEICMKFVILAKIASLEYAFRFDSKGCSWSEGHTKSGF